MTINSLRQLQDQYHIWLIAPKDWRLIPDMVVGEINGLPSMRGEAVATNGIHVVIITSNNTPLLGHLDWFIPDKDERSNLLKSTTKQPTKTNMKEFEEFFT